MKLSEAIREGCKIVPVQGHDGFVNDAEIDSTGFVDPTGKQVDGQGPIECACALGTLAVGIDPSIAGLPVYKAFWHITDLLDEPGLKEALAQHLPHPIRLIREPRSVFSIIVTLNDDYRWTREQIADWLSENGL
jgi:hypothetical protein